MPLYKLDDDLLGKLLRSETFESTVKPGHKNFYSNGSDPPKCNSVNYDDVGRDI